MQCLQLPESVRANLEAWRLDLDLEAPVRETDWALLGGEESDRALRMRRHEDRVRFVRTRAALRRLLGARLHCKPQAVRLARGPHGKPRLAEVVGLDFNISHAGRHALIALASRGHVGVDIERCNPELDTASLEPMVASPQEQHLAVAERPGFFDRWVAKEAVLKALGLGVAQHLQQVSVLPSVPADEGPIHFECSDPAWPPLGAWRLSAPPGYVCAIAWTVGPSVQIQ